MGTSTAEQPEPTSVGELLDRIDEAANREEQVSVDSILDQVGHRSFGPMLLFAGLVMLAPVIGDIPSVPTLMGTLVVLTAGQLLFTTATSGCPTGCARARYPSPRCTRP